MTAEPDDPQLLDLVRDLRADLTTRYPELTDFSHRIPKPPFHSLLAWLDGRAVGCCAVQALPEGEAELKRMYVRPDARRKGIAVRLLAAAERLAAEHGHQQMRLETGVRQPEAIALYTRAGFTRIPNYPPFLDSPFSVCFAKPLTPSPITGCAPA